MKEIRWGVVLLLLMALTACLNACAAEEACAHAHTTETEEGPTVEIVATETVCTRSTTLTVLRCADCGSVLSSSEKTTENTAHRFSPAQVVKAPCLQEGESSSVCQDCGYEKKTTLPAAGHEKTALVETKPATCATPGNERYHCGVCGQDWDVPTPTTSHDFQWAVIAKATCQTNQDENACVCTVCGADSGQAHVFTENIVLHTPVLNEEKTNPPSCGKPGIKTFSCSVCGAVTSWEEIPALEHAPVWQTETEPSCTEDGVSVYRCLNCGEEFERKVLPRLGHLWQTVAEEDNACGKEGHSEYQKCGREGCGVENPEKPKAVYPALEHQFDEIVPGGREPSCTEDGVRTLKCTNVSYKGVPCGATTEEILPAPGHQHDDHWQEVYPATCESAGQEVSRCLVCDLDEQYREIPQKSHEYPSAAQVCADASQVGEKGAILQEPTCTTGGKARVTCTLCHQSTSEIELPALGHRMGEWVVDEERSEPTCELDKISVRKCERCEYKESKTEAAALGHSWIQTDQTVNATCTQSGILYARCERCGKEADGVEIPPTGHNYTQSQTPATCTAAGVIVYECSNCGDSYEELLPMLEHSYDEGKVETLATCVKEGVRAYTCSECGKIEREPIPKADHDFYTVVLREATATEKGEKVSRCAVCGVEVDRVTVNYDKLLYYKPITGVGIPVSQLDEEIVSKANATVVDMTMDEQYEYALVAMSKYTVGRMTITVEKGEMTVSTEVNAYNVFGGTTLYASLEDLSAGQGTEIVENERMRVDGPIALVVFSAIGNVDVGVAPLCEENVEIVQDMRALLQNIRITP